MARKKGEIQLQRDIETQEEWEEVMAMEGLWVVDVYQEWCGPCLALVGNFRRLKNEMGDPLLNFAMAKADTIDALEKYRGRCEPTFLFFAGGILTSYIHGADAPKVQSVITEQLASEHKILEGLGERKEVKDPVITRAEEINIERLAEEEAQRKIEAEKAITVAIIKPDAIAQGKIEDIIAEIKENDIDILAKEECEISQEQARKLYSNLEDEPYFDEILKYMSSGPSYVMILTRANLQMTIIKDWREMIGPFNVEQAKEEAPSCMRARYGEKGFVNALHGSASKEAAAKEVALFFPNYKIPTFQKKKVNIQRTLGIIRPEAHATKSNAILQKITAAGFKIAMIMEVELSKEQTAEFYKEYEHYAYFDSLVETMCSGPFLALGLSKDDAIKAWRDALGPSNIDDALEKAPNCLRAQFPGSTGINQLHGSENEKAAKEELSYFFPMEQTLAVIKPDFIGSKDEIIATINEAGFKIAAKQETTISQAVAEILYPKKTNEPYYDELINYMTSGSMVFMILSREGAISGWRQEMGDVDPETARTKNTDSLRAQFGKDILHNAVHGSSSIAHANREIKAVFGELKFNEDGTIRGFQPELDETSEVLERDRTSDAEDEGPEYNEYDRDDAEQDVMRGENQQEDETNNAATEDPEQPRTPEEGRVAHDKAEEGSRHHTPGTPQRPDSSHDLERAEEERQKGSFDEETDKENQNEHYKSTQEHRGSDGSSHKQETRSHDGMDKDEHRKQEETAKHDPQGSHHSLVKMEAEHQSSSHYGVDNDHQSIEVVNADAETVEEEPEVEQAS